MTDPDLAFEDASWLVSDEGLEALATVVDALDRGEEPLAVGSRLRAGGTAPTRAAAVMSAATTRRRWRGRLPEDIVATRAAAEQASRPIVAEWRARRFTEHGGVVDLCCGIGVDAIALGHAAGSVIAVDRDPARVVLARHNLAARGVTGQVVLGDALEPPIELHGAIHVDPSRRRGQRRVRRLDRYDPPVPSLSEVLRPATGSGIVVSPGVDLDDPALPEGSELEFVQVGADLVEAVVWSGDLRGGGGDVVATATLLPDELSVSRTRSETSPGAVAPPGEWLVEFAPAAVRARVHERLGADIGASRLAERRALHTTSDEPTPSPWYVASPIEAVLPVRGRHLREWLGDRQEDEVEFVVHGLDVDLATLWRDAGRPARGPHGRRVHLVRLDQGASAIVTARPTAERTREMT